MACHTFLLLSLYIGSALAQSSTLTESPASTDVPDTSNLGDVNADYKLWGYEGCSSGQVDAIKSGFSDMIIMLMGEGAIVTKYPTFDWNSAVAQDYWGPADRNRLYRKQIKDNLDRLAAVTYDWRINPFASSLHVRCDDKGDSKESCKSLECEQTGSKVLAYTIKHEPHINFCPGYFTQRTLTEALHGGDWVSASGYFNQATVWAHELMHVAAIGHVADGAPRSGIDDHLVEHWAARAGMKAYGPLNTKWIAQDPSGSYWQAAENADNYAYFVTLNFMQKQLGYYLSDPQIQITPEIYQPRVVTNITLESETEGNGARRCEWV